MDHIETVDAASRSLSRPGAPVRLRLEDVVVDYPGAASVVLRCSSGASSTHLPLSVVIKRWNEGGGGSFRQEWAALDFLGNISDVRMLVPIVYGADPAAELLVLEDLTVPGQRMGLDSPHLLGNILFGDDPQHAESALLAFNRALGHLHGATIGRSVTFQRSQSRCGAADVSRHGVHRLTDALTALPDLLTEYEVRTPDSLATEIDAACMVLREPGHLRSFTHGDPTPGNVQHRNGQIQLLDFEAAAYRHALVDGSFASVRYLYSVWARRIPDEIRHRSLVAYRDSLIQRCPAAGDDQVFGHALVACCAAWLAVLCGFLPSVVGTDVKWGRSTRRQRIATAIGHFVPLAQEFGAFDAIAAAADDLGGRLRHRWPPEDRSLQPYPALARKEAT